MTQANADAALARIRAVAGPELVERLVHLDRVWSARAQARVADDLPRAPEANDAVDYDVVLAGGGLWSLLAPVLAARGLSVAVFDRARVAEAHREWNASGGELRALVRCGLVDDESLASLVVARYERGTCRFAGGGDYPVFDVLDHAVDAGPLLAQGRALGEARGVHYFDGRPAGAAAVGGDRVRLRVASPERDVTARVLVDARGAASPYASADLVCPTVGGVLSGLMEGDGPKRVCRNVGEILVTVDGIDARGRQHVWEGFPGRSGETTVYLFYYARASEPASLVELYARFFDTLPDYKAGDARLVRPTFGFIPGWSRLAPPPRAPAGPIVLVGDAAARHSALTYCGFGSFLRSVEPAANAITALASGASPARDSSIVDDAPIHALTGALSQILATRALTGDALNGLLDAAFKTLHELGQDRYAALLRDEMAPADFVRFLRRTAARHPAVWSDVVRGLGTRAAGRWSVLVARSLWS